MHLRAARLADLPHLRSDGLTRNQAADDRKSQCSVSADRSQSLGMRRRQCFPPSLLPQQSGCMPQIQAAEVEMLCALQAATKLASRCDEDPDTLPAQLRQEISKALHQFHRKCSMLVQQCAMYGRPAASLSVCWLLSD